VITRPTGRARSSAEWPNHALDSPGSPVMWVNFRNACPFAGPAPKSNAAAMSLGVEEGLELAHEGLPRAAEPRRSGSLRAIARHGSPG